MGLSAAVVGAVTYGKDALVGQIQDQIDALQEFEGLEEEDEEEEGDDGGDSGGKETAKKPESSRSGLGGYGASSSQDLELEQQQEDEGEGKESPPPFFFQQDSDEEEENDKQGDGDNASSSTSGAPDTGSNDQSRPSVDRQESCGQSEDAPLLATKDEEESGTVVGAMCGTTTSISSQRPPLPPPTIVISQDNVLHMVESKAEHYAGVDPGGRGSNHRRSPRSNTPPPGSPS